jgi:hypothetical protein
METFMKSWKELATGRRDSSPKIGRHRAVFPIEPGCVSTVSESGSFESIAAKAFRSVLAIENP